MGKVEKENIKKLLETYGSDSSKWPVNIPEPVLKKLVESNSLDDEFNSARNLDQILTEYKIENADNELINSIIENSQTQAKAFWYSKSFYAYAASLILIFLSGYFFGYFESNLNSNYLAEISSIIFLI